MSRHFKRSVSNSSAKAEQERNVAATENSIRACLKNAVGARAVSARSSRKEPFVGAATGDRSRAGRKAAFSKRALIRTRLMGGWAFSGGSPGFVRRRSEEHTSELQ